MERIAVLQLGYLLFISRGVIMLSLLPVVPATPGGRDAWIASTIATLMGMALVPLVCRVVNLGPEQDLIQILETHFGKVIGKFVAFLYLGFFALNAAVVLRQFSEFLTTAPMPETPTELFLGFMALTTAYAVRKGLEVIARVAELLVIPLVLFVLVVFAMGGKDMDPSRLKPVLAEGWGPALRGSLTAAALWGELLIITVLAPAVKRRKQMPGYVLGTVVAGGMWLGLSAAVVVMFFSAPEAQAQIFPVFILMRTVSLADFLERFDPLFLLAWTTGSFLKLALLSHVSCFSLARILGLANYRSLALPMGFLGAVVALQQFESMADLRALNSSAVLPVLVFPFAVAFPMALLAVGGLRNKGSTPR